MKQTVEDRIEQCVRGAGDCLEQATLAVANHEWRRAACLYNAAANYLKAAVTVANDEGCREEERTS
jgi:hypothetical protein